MNNIASNLILASSSPRRKELLRHLINEFSTVSANIDESPEPDETPNQHVNRLARAKTLFVANQHPNAYVLGSDTVIGFADEIMGKPKNEQHFLQMMSKLSGNIHQVYTGICVMNVQEGIEYSEVISTNVEFTTLSKRDIIAYWHTNEPKDKAGGYAIQGIGGQFVKGINGSVSSVIGLPLAETKQVLVKAGVLS